MVAFGELVWAVANARNLAADFAAQTQETFLLLDTALQEAGSDHSRMLSVQVLLANIEDRWHFDELWRDWIGPNPDHWPQRACFQTGLAPGLLIELVVTAARAETPR